MHAKNMSIYGPGCTHKKGLEAANLFDPTEYLSNVAIWFFNLFISSGLYVDDAIVFQANEKPYFLVPQEFQVFNERIPTVDTNRPKAQTPLE
jgi:hypothetical protein